jgi:hypothetical protein
LYADCEGYCVFDGYVGGVCRISQRICLQNNERYEPAANRLCPMDLRACCCQPATTTTQAPPPKTTPPTTLETAPTTSTIISTTTTQKTNLLSCFNGVRDQGEEGVDCGGSCWSPCDYSRPQLVIGGATLLEPNSTAFFKVTDQFGTEVGQINVALRNPAGDVEIITTDEHGQYNLTNTLAGMWKFTAVKDGFEPATKNLLAINIFSPQIIAAVAVIAGSTTLLPYLIFWFFYRRRQGTYVEPAAIRLMLDARELKKIHSLPQAAEIYPELMEEGRLKTIKITKKIQKEANQLKQLYNLTDDTSLTLAAAQQKRAKKTIINYDIPEELKTKLKPLKVSTTHEETG